MEPERNSLTTDQIFAMCQRGFGNNIKIDSSHEITGGTFNIAYRVTFTDQRKVVLRVAPSQTTDTAWEDVHLMRAEHAMRPYFAPVAALMPRTLMVDFTHQLIDRDYMFQTFLEGERWDEVGDEMTPPQNNILWSQFGGIMRQIHDVRGERFGLPRPGFQFDTWSQAVFDRIERTLQAAKDLQLDTKSFARILDLIRAYPAQLDEIRVPRLLHGDLWLFNILVTRGGNAPRIAGILDADRSWWGDPMADWTMFILKHAEKDEGHAHFWQSYGAASHTRGAQFRKIVYDGMHAGTALVWSARHNDEGTVKRAYGTLSDVAALLPSLL